MALREDLRLDANAEDFSAVTRVSIGPRGQIAIPLYRDLHVRLYDADGRRIATVGRRGSGPGEFGSLTALGWIRDTLWVLDGAQKRTTFVAPDGSVLRTVAFTLPLGEGTAGPGGRSLLSFGSLGMFADGSMLGQARQEARGSAAREAWGERVLVHVTRSGQATVVGPVPDEHDPRWFLTLSGFGRYLPFAFRPQVVVAGDGQRVGYLTTEITSSTGGTHSVLVLRQNGDTVFHRAFPFRGTPIPRRAADSAIAALAPPPGRPVEGPADLTSRFQALARERMPPVYAPVQSMALGIDGTVWVTLRDSAQTRMTMILNGRGDPIGRVRLSPRTRVWAGSASHLWMGESDADGVVSVVRYRIIGLNCGRGGCGPGGD
ncbi:MAG TPA: hypothetical protein VF178_01380 [Gemmatimonadaceae bacterium]